MFSYHPLPGYLLLLVTVILATSRRGASLCPQDQSAALLRLKASFRIDNSSLYCGWVRSPLPSWKAGTDCCSWERVTCDGASGYVTALDLSDLCISGNLSSSSDIFKLTSLRFLSLAGNNFDASPWPRPGFEQLKDLKYLDLSYSGLSGDLPIENGQLSNLATLNLSGLDLKDLNLETLIDSLGSLQKLYLDEAYISINPTDLAPATSGNTTSCLKELRMRWCTITGGRFDTVLTNLVFHSKLANLVTLELSDFDLKNLSLYSLIGSLTKLQSLYLENVNISVSPTDLAYASSTNTTSGLKELGVWDCTITSGQFDTFLLDSKLLANLVMLSLSDVDLKFSSLRTLIDSLGNLENLHLGNVEISARPTDLTVASSTNTTSGLKELTMEYCTVTGDNFGTVLADIRFLSMLPNLITLNLYCLDFKNVSLDAFIYNHGSLQKINLFSVNIFLSPIRSAHAYSSNKTPSLRELSMQGCTISGRIDIALAKFRFLSKVTLDGTKFSDPAVVPERFVEFSSLKVLSLRGCGLNGTFPSWIFHIKSLISLDMSWNDNLCGELPEFIEGSALQELKLSGTKFSGKIPESISNLRNLTMLNLSNCQFNGSIPPFAQWPMIQLVDLSDNNLTGSLPSDGYLALHNLTTVNLSNNSISGVVPASLFSHPSLEYLDLSRNSFSGNFLLDPNVSSNLAYVDVSRNKLQGPIPKLLLELVGIYHLDLSLNSFNGTIDLSFMKNYNGPGYLYLSLSYNSLTVVEEDGNHSYSEYPIIGELELASCNLSFVPKFLMHQSHMSDLDLSNNNIGGHIPDWIWGTGDPFGLTRLNLSHNLFTSVGTNLSNSPVVDLDLHSNKIEGALPLPPSGAYQLDYSNNYFSSSIMPDFWSSITYVVSLSLANNSLTGDVSHLVCTATELIVLDLSFNSKDNMYLQILSLRENNFHGSLPQYISEECALQIIDLNGNKLEGKMPVSMVNCHMLQVLDLGNNLIVDNYPEWLGALPLLKVLVLASNRFHGPIDYYGLNKLQVLDLSSNSLNGSIHARFLKQFKAMMVSSGAPSMYVEIVAPSASKSASASVHSAPAQGLPITQIYRPNYREWVTITLKVQGTTLQIFSQLMYIDLSNNNFEGIIPNEIGDLKLLKGLNLSKNSFTSRIPNRIANMLQLESLDLSCNQLSGEIPSAMALMSFLEVLNLSYNHLSGMIPQSSQFSTFPETSFLGNDGLCGKPLPRPCNTNHTPSADAAATPESSKELNWEFFSVEAGVVSGLVIVFVSTLLWGNGRRWLYCQVDKFLLDILHPWIDGRHH